MMDKVIIWGTGNDYERIINQIQFEVYKGNIEVVALVSKEDSVWAKEKDGYSLIGPDGIKEREYDFIVVVSSKYFMQIKQEAQNYGATENQIVNGLIFLKPLFDWNRYISLIKNPVTILSDDCWGGYIYHELYLQFSSPCINISWSKEDFIRFAQNPLWYLNFDLVMEIEGSVRGNQCPIGSLGEGNEKICMEFVHSTCFADAKSLWDKRKERVNKERIFVKCGIPANSSNKKYLLEEYKKIPFSKVCFYSGEDANAEDIVYLKRFEQYVHQGERTGTLVYSDYIRVCRDLLYRDVDILKMLNNEEFLR